MKNLANTIGTLSLNLNMLTEDLAALQHASNDAQKVQDITLRIRQRAALDAIGKTLFATSV